jgi:hypothetical protein
LLIVTRDASDFKCYVYCFHVTVTLLRHPLMRPSMMDPRLTRPSYSQLVIFLHEYISQ